jgi:hypothetical protein
MARKREHGRIVASMVVVTRWQKFLSFFFHPSLSHGPSGPMGLFLMMDAGGTRQRLIQYELS